MYQSFRKFYNTQKLLLPVVLSTLYYNNSNKFSLYSNPIQKFINSKQSVQILENNIPIGIAISIGKGKFIALRQQIINKQVQLKHLQQKDHQTYNINIIHDLQNENIVIFTSDIDSEACKFSDFQLGDETINIGIQDKLVFINKSYITNEGESPYIDNSSINYFLQSQNKQSISINNESKIVGLCFENPDNQNSSICISSKSLKELQNLKNNENPRAYLGLACKQTQDKKGVFVISVSQESPAESSGLRVGDIIYSINKQEVRNLNQFLLRLGFGSGKSYLLGIERNGKQTDLILNV